MILTIAFGQGPTEINKNIILNNFHLLHFLRVIDKICPMIWFLFNFIHMILSNKKMKKLCDVLNSLKNEHRVIYPAKTISIFIFIANCKVSLKPKSEHNSMSTNHLRCTIIFFSSVLQITLERSSTRLKLQENSMCAWVCFHAWFIKIKNI